MKLIDKAALAANIEARYNECLKRAKIIDAEYWGGKADAYRDMLVVLDTIEVKDEAKEVDLEKELSYEDYIRFFGEHPDFPDDWGFDEAWVFAKYFFELGGLKHRKVNNMTDKAQKILSEITTRKLCTMDEHMAFYNDKAKEDYRLLSDIEEFIKALPEEPVSEDLEEAAKDYSNNLYNIYGSIGEQTRNAFKAGAKWKEQQMMSKAVNGVEINSRRSDGRCILSGNFSRFDTGDKVKLIIIKQE